MKVPSGERDSVAHTIPTIERYHGVGDVNDAIGQKVLVTGGSGFLAGWMILGLLSAGYEVRTTLRRPNDAESAQAAIAAQGVPTDGLTFCTADLLGDVGWDKAVEGCQTVMHVASPMGQGQGRHADIVTPARDGTLRVLRAAERGGVQRVIVTSSTIAAQRNSAQAQPAGEDESNWTNINLRGTGSYARAKVIAERAAWGFIQDSSRNVMLTTILPGMILGPVLRNVAAGSVEVIARMLSGKMPRVPRIGFSVVDVRDLVDLHILAMKSERAADQRFIGVSNFLWLSDMAEHLKSTLGKEAVRVSSKRMPDAILRIAALFNEQARFMAPLVGKHDPLSAQKARQWLGWQPRPAADSVIDCARSLISRDLV